ncbi:hypothetical protein, partial [Mesorhizobium sp. M1D.F.Ca.ET.231.01.1.1]|uniref:hypothetical protein n=1 Tax=Mesorhizobium sp. M1D.F.Ca.ET.231.01.1.1 TaxID=2496669 RepID=UPI001AEEB4F7
SGSPSRTGGASRAASSHGCDASHGGRQMAVDYTTHDGVAVITLNNPPVNGLQPVASDARINAGSSREIARFFSVFISG